MRANGTVKEVGQWKQQVFHAPGSVIQVLPDYNISHVAHGHRPDGVRAHHLDESIQKLRSNDARVSSVKTVVPGRRITGKG